MAIENHGKMNGNSDKKSEESEVVVVMFPFPSQGHLNQLLNFSRVITSHNLPVYFVSTCIHNRQAKLRAAGWDPLKISNLHFYDLPVHEFAAATPDPNSDDKFPSHMQSLGAVLFLQRQKIFYLLRDLAKKSKRVVFIIDFAIYWLIPDVSSVPKTESYCFHTFSSFVLHALSRLIEENSVLVHGRQIQDQIPPMGEIFGPDALVDYFMEHLNAKKWNHGNLYNTSRAIEGEFVQLLEKDKLTNGEKHWAIGPLNQISIPERKNLNNECLEWLDKQSPNSVILVSFGTTTCLRDEEVAEIAMGLEQSEQKFMWIIRYADKADSFEGEGGKVRLPDGFIESIEGRGIVIRDWAPQLEILAHSSTGGFLSHCGWSSCMESISMGVPIAAWPMHSDQPLNAYLLTEILKIGVTVRNEYKIQRSDEIVKARSVEEAVRKLMNSPEGDELRKRADELSRKLRQSLEKDGVTEKERTSFMDHITR